jgi:hypothetical protein
MKDKQIPTPGTEPRIPVISAVLHSVSMTVLVFLRSSFGFAYLSPKSVFFAFSWAFILFTIVAWNEPEIWREFRVVCFFGMAAVILYWLHLFGAFLRELYGKGEHDHYSGRSHPLRLMRKKGRVPGSVFEMNLHLWGEPAAILIGGLALRLVLRERHLSMWFVLVAVCLWFKEAFNYWHQLRQRKRQGDIFEDAGETVEPHSATESHNSEPPKATRKAPVKRGRSAAATAEAERERRAAELLRLLPPYSLEKAEENYHALIKTDHPDANDGTPESTAMSAELNEAIAYFREKFRT